MLTVYEEFTQYECKRLKREYYNQAANHTKRVIKKHRHYDIIPKKEQYKHVDWDFISSPVKDEQSIIIKKIKNALNIGNFSLARQLATESAKYYQANNILQEYARILAPPRIINNNLPPTSSVRANYAWLKAHRQQYKGYWIAVYNGQLVGVGESLDSLVNDIGQTEGILLTKA